MKNYRLVLAFSGALGALALGLEAGSLPKGEFWNDNPHLTVVALSLVFLGSLAGIFEAVGTGRRARADRLELVIQDPLKALFTSLLNLVGINHFQTLGIHTFLLKWRISLMWPPIHRELVEASEIQLRSVPKSGVRWTKGKGAIGLCWKLNQDVSANLESDWRDYRDLSEHEWNALPAELRYGLSFQEFLRTRDYRAIVVTPIQDKSGNFRGCVSVDSTAELYDALWAARPREAMQNAAQMVSHLAGLS